MRNPIVWLLLSVGCLAISAGLSLPSPHIRRALDDLAWYKRTIQRKQGFLMGTNYDMASFDSGHTWFNVKTDDDGYHILGPADPDLVSRIDGMDNMVKRAQEHQLNPLDPADGAVIEKAGIKIVVTTKPS